MSRASAASPARRSSKARYINTLRNRAVHEEKRISPGDASGAVNAHFTNGAFAIFQGTPGTVTVSDANGPVSAGGVQLAADGYLIQGDAIELDGSTPANGSQSIFRVGDGTQAVLAPLLGCAIFCSSMSPMRSGAAHIPLPICALPDSPQASPT